MILAACDDSHTPLAPQPAPGSARLAALSSAPVAFYSFDQDAGDGDVFEAEHRATGGYQGGAYYFNGEGAYIDLPVDVNPETMPQATMGAWARVESTFSLRRAQVLSHDDGWFDRTMGLEPRLNGSHGFSTFVGEVGGGVLVGPDADLRRWVFLAAVYDGGTVTLYVDGRPYTTEAMPEWGYSFLRVGGNPGFYEPFHGVIDNVFVYDRALSAAEIATIRTGGACAVVTPCVGAPGNGVLREGLGRIAQLVSQAGIAGEMKAAQVRHLRKVITHATEYLDRADAMTKPQREATMLRYILVELDEALTLLRGTGSNTVAARDETVRVRGLVQARLSGI